MNLSPNIRASLYMMLSMMGFSINDSFIKSLDGAMPVGQVMAIRGAFLLLLVSAIVVQQGLHKRLLEVINGKVVLRSLMEALATLCFLAALNSLPFATVSAILQALPLTVAVGAAIFFAEPVGWRRWLAIGIGFLGVIVIIRPGMGGFEPASLLVLVSVLFAATRDLLSRALPASLPSLLVSGATTFVICIAGASITTVQGSWQAVTTDQLIVLASASFFLFFGYQFIVMAMRTGEVAYVVPFRYSSLLWSILLGYMVFDELPDQFTLIGSAIVIFTGLFTLYREVVTRRKLKRKSTV